MAKLDPLFFEALTLWLGSLNARRVTWGLVAGFTVWILLDVFVLHVTSGMARSSYDAMVRGRVLAAAPDPRMVIVDIDEASLARMGKEFGRWPWPRDTLATVLDFVEKQQPAAVVWDIVFSDADVLSPGGDKAFDAAVARSAHSHFAVVRLPPANDKASQLTRQQLPGLWSTGSSGTPASSVAMIAPVLPAVAASRLGFNNGYPDGDGMLRRYRHQEVLPDGSRIQSLASSVAGSVLVGGTGTSAAAASTSDELIAWRKKSQAYPRVSFADVFAVAEGETSTGKIPSFGGKIILIGSTAPSLHDIHPTPLSPLQPGVETLATVIDNAINQRKLAELPDWFQAAFAIAMCMGIAWWVQARGIDSLGTALVALPATLVVISFASLNLMPFFLDLNLPAGLALLFLGALRYWNGLRQQYWLKPPASGRTALMLLPLWCSKPWKGEVLDRLISALESRAPSCRVLVSDASGNLRWPELAGYAAIVGPHDVLSAALDAIKADLGPGIDPVFGTPVAMGAAADRSTLVQSSMTAWAELKALPQKIALAVAGVAAPIQEKTSPERPSP
ncbi:MAG: CHASE2 domain-containing protein [Pseudomonadota bacterium]